MWPCKNKKFNLLNKKERGEIGVMGKKKTEGNYVGERIQKNTEVKYYSRKRENATRRRREKTKLNVLGK
jgi:hypothetical protein